MSDEQNVEETTEKTNGCCEEDSPCKDGCNIRNSVLLEAARGIFREEVIVDGVSCESEDDIRKVQDSIEELAEQFNITVGREVADGDVGQIEFEVSIMPKYLKINHGPVNVDIDAEGIIKGYEGETADFSEYFKEQASDFLSTNKNFLVALRELLIASGYDFSWTGRAEDCPILMFK